MNKTEQLILELMSGGGYDVVMQNAGIFRFPSNYRFESHSHMAYEINYINTGCCIMGVGDDYVPLKQGDCIIVNPYASHCFMVDVKNACRITQVEMAVMMPSHIKPGISFLEHVGDYHKLCHCEGILRQLENICYLHRMKREDSYMKAQLDFAMAQLYAGLSYYIDEKKAEQSPRKQDRIGKMIRYINQNLEEDINLEELSAQFGISSRYVRKYFLQQMGMKCTEYITMLRIGKAKELLWEPSYSITDVALMAGFNSSQYFCRSFRNYVGMTPAEYRRMWRDKEAEG